MERRQVLRRIGAANNLSFAANCVELPRAAPPTTAARRFVMNPLYIRSRRPPRRTPFLAGVLAFLFTAAIIVLALVVTRSPARLFAAFNLPAPKFLIGAEPTPSTTDTPTPDPGATETARAKPRPTNTRIPTRTPRPTATLVPTATPFSVSEHLVLGRPVQPDAYSIIAAWTYLYGDTAGGDLEVHHGEEFVNPQGTPLIAVGDGTIVTAGSDSEPACGVNSGDSLCGPVPDYYGNLVVLKLDQTLAGQPIFALYGHMSKVGVQVGQHVSTGEVLGAIGATGVATGPHVHFEVRLGVNDYAHTRNPVLWLKPLAGRGSLAGAVLDRSGNFIRTVNVFLYIDNETQDYVQDTETYGRDADPKLSPVNSDDQLKENWAMGDLKAGKYLVRAQIGGLNYLRHVTIEDGKLTFVLFGGP